jgi:3-methyladenine DNA glycosylase AlkD
MHSKKNPPSQAPRAKPPSKPRNIKADVRFALAWLKRRGSRRNVEGMARYGITAARVFGVSVANLHVLAKRLGQDHALAQALWATGWYEARMLAAFVDDPAQVTMAQMDAWAADFDNWAICDTACFHLFDRTPRRTRPSCPSFPWLRRRPRTIATSSRRG